MKKVSCVVAVLVSTVLSSAGLGAEPPDTNPSFWMKKKLEYSEKILAALAKEDFETIGNTAHSMNALSQMEKWARSGLPDYRDQLHIFQNSNKQLIRMAEKSNLDGAALAYVQMTLSCVNCHKVMRDSRRTQPADKK